MQEDLEPLALLHQVVHAHRPIVVGLESISERLVEVDAGSTVEDDVYIFNDHFSDFRVDTKPLQTKVTEDGNDPFLSDFKYFWPLFEEWCENF